MPAASLGRADLTGTGKRSQLHWPAAQAIKTHPFRVAEQKDMTSVTSAFEPLQMPV
jgi:hypothetical protein